MTPADPFDIRKFPYGKRAGDNKFGMTKCPTCDKPPTHPNPTEYPDHEAQIPAQGFYMFRDILSAKEYYISGLCQTCQDSVFKCDEVM